MSKKNILIFIYCLAAVFSFFAGVVLAGDNRLPVLLTSTAGFLLFAAAGFKFRREFINERIGREEQLYSVVSNSGAVFFMADTHGGLIYADNGCRSLEKKISPDCSTSEFSSIFPYLHEESKFISLREQLGSEGGVCRFETEHDCPTGQRIVLSHTLQELYAPDGCVCALAGTIRDISVLREAQDALAKEGRYFDAVLDGVEEAVFVYDLEGNLLKVNKRVADFAGTGDPELCRGINLHNYLAPHVSDAAMQGVRDIIGSGKDCCLQIPVTNSSGEKVLLDVRNYLCRDESGNPEAIVGFARRASRQTEHHETDIVKGDSSMMQILCHELRTPLAGIIGSLHVLDTKVHDPEAKEYIQKCVVSVERFKNVVNSSLKGLAGSPDEAEKESLDPAACFGKAVELFLPAVSIQNRNITLSIGSGLPEAVFCRRNSLPQALFSLINKGLEFFPDSDISAGVKMCAAFEGCPSIAFYVSGYRHNASTEDNIYVESLENAAGTIGAELYFEPGATTEFGFKIPVAPDGSNKAKDIESVQDLRIMLAEDDISSQVFMRRKLESWGHMVRTASTGVEVINYMKEHEYDLVLMDLQMPEMNGFDAIASIRECESPRNRIPIIVMSAYGRESDFERMSDLGVDDYIVKPVSTDDLEKALERLVSLGRL
ncbi:response regulator [Maridesulfovibrio sp.]|uniref:response regulator n=1 Tax=Maridesulfovibrio sp. TaxID=2795000 RepID=UPI0029CA09DD|nr:response regulator [Maridesulfovibrio sp.]